MHEKCHIDNKIQQVLMRKKLPENCPHVKYFRSLSKLPQPHNLTPGANLVSERPRSNVETASATSQQQQQQQQWRQLVGHSDWNCNLDCLRR